MLLSNVSGQVLEQYGDITLGLIPGEFYYLIPFQWVDEKGKSHRWNVPTLYVWTNFMIGKLEQLHRIFSFIPRKNRVIGANSRVSSSLLIEKAGRLLRQPLAVIMQFLVKPNAFFVAFQMELSFILNESIRVRMVAVSQGREESSTVGYSVTDNAGHDSSTQASFRGMIAPQIQSPFALTILETLNSNTILSSSSVISGSSDEVFTDVVVPSIANPSSASSSSYYSSSDLLQQNSYHFISQTDFVLLLLPTQYFSTNEIPQALTSSPFTRVLSSFIGGLFLFSPSGTSINPRQAKLRLGQRTPSLSQLSMINPGLNLRVGNQISGGGGIQKPSSILPLNNNKPVQSGNALLFSIIQQLLCISSSVLEAASSSSGSGGVDGQKGSDIGEGSSIIQSGLQFVINNEICYLRSMILPQKMDFMNPGLSSINFSMYYLQYCRIIPLVRLKNRSFISLGGEIVDETFLRNNGLILVPVAVNRMHPITACIYCLYPRDRVNITSSINTSTSANLNISSNIRYTASSIRYAADSTFVVSTNCIRSFMN
jgi:hypothetical protein